MIKNSLILIGKRSFIGSNIYDLLKKNNKIKLVSLNEFLQLKTSYINKYDYLCNCTDNQNKLKKNYSDLFDFDFKILRKIINTNIKYIFLSSRRVYSPKFNTKETQKILPIDTYSKNKSITEKTLKKEIKSKLLILRISNVIGFKKYRKYRKIHKTFFDNYLEIIKKGKKIKYINFYKDFITIKQLSNIFDLILKKKITGTYNVSLGKKIYIKEMIKWLNTNNLNNDIFLEEKKSKQYLKKYSFTLNNDKLSKKINYTPKKKELQNYCIKLSKKIHK
jgi:dTDP-4-dehydrorhamnose reductase